MLKLIIGVKGTGKTKLLIQMVNDAIESTAGDVVCIEKGNKLIHDVNYRCRLISADEYMINDASGLIGFVAGMIASNHDITDLFIDSAYKICKFDNEAFDKFIEAVNAITEKYNVKLVITASIPAEEASETVKKYI